MASKNNRARLLHYIKLCASFQIHQWIQTGLTVWKHSVWVKMDDFLSCVTFKYYGWSWKIIGHLFHATSKLCASFHSHWWIQTGVTVRKRPIWVKTQNWQFFYPCDLVIWQMTLKNNRAPLFYATSTFVHHSVAIGEFKLELQSGNGQFGSKSTIF